MRLVLATPLYPPEAGGPATFAKVMEEELPKRGHTVTTIKFGDVRQLPKLVRHAAYGYRVWQAARKGDIVLALDPVSTGLPALLAARLARKKFFVRVAGDYAWEQGVQRWDVHDTLDTFAPSTRYPLPVRILKNIEAFVARSAVRVIVPSEYLARIVSFWGVSHTRVVVAYNAGPLVAPEYPKPGVAKSYAVSIARLVPWKGMDVLVHAFRNVKKPELLVVVGDGPEREKVEAAAKDAGIEDRVLFTGNLPHDEALAYLAHAECFILNTRYEGLSHLILEAFALNVPVLTTDVGGNREVVHDGETGLVFPFGIESRIVERIAEITKSKKLRASVTSAAHALVLTFTTERMVDRVLEALSV
jgi:glycosyltransferase involved in cell wall biosynthesis